ncbi:MAG: hypothetical protein HN521_13335 [Candidatus Latescibacteria bacterium]|jgi:hypothetical protein|nr:hypothetical protein [Candidatus Latescibacterota bacterium]
MTKISIQNTSWYLNNQITYPGAPAEGLLMNVRMVNATFEDRNRTDFDPTANTNTFIGHIPNYYDHGIRAFTLCLQGGMPDYEGALNSAFNPDGSLRQDDLNRVASVIHACDQQGIAIILGCYYQRQDQVLENADAIRQGVINTARWVSEQKYSNVMIEVANEYAHRGFTHDIIRDPEGQSELIQLAKETAPQLIVTTSGMGSGRMAPAIAEAADFLIIHFNNTDIADVPDRINALKHFEKPILCNEDTKINARGAEVASLCVQHDCSWGLMRSRVNQSYPFVFSGANDDQQTYARLKELTSIENS